MTVDIDLKYMDTPLYSFARFTKWGHVSNYLYAFLINEGIPD